MVRGIDTRNMADNEKAGVNWMQLVQWILLPICGFLMMQVYNDVRALANEQASMKLEMAVMKVNSDNQSQNMEALRAQLSRMEEKLDELSKPAKR